MKFKVGDPVRVIARTCSYFDQTGTVTAINEGHDYPFHVEGPESWPLWFGPHELVLAEYQPREAA
jgi:hypothetical protein